VSEDRKCRTCGGLDEFMYELNWQPVFYCATCDAATFETGAEMVGPAKRREEEAGEAR
jgi:hypothetical protein